MRCQRLDRMIAGRLGGVFNVFTASWAATRTSIIPSWSTTTTRSSRKRRQKQGYHLTEDLVDRAISFIADTRQVAPDKPFFLYFATGAMHAPHHVPQEWADKYKGQFDDGWDAYREKVFARQVELGIVPADAQLSRHDPDVKPWEACTPEERKVYARMMEVYAGFLEHTDYHIGRLLDFLKRINAYDDTLIIAVSDNGASSEGGPNGMININMWHNNLPGTVEDNLRVLDELGGPEHFNHYAWGWTFAGNTPFRRWKRETYRGGISDPLIVHWPASIADRERHAAPVRSCHRPCANGARLPGHRAASDHPRRDTVAD